MASQPGDTSQTITARHRPPDSPDVEQPGTMREVSPEELAEMRRKKAAEARAANTANWQTSTPWMREYGRLAGPAQAEADRFGQRGYHTGGRQGYQANEGYYRDRLGRMDQASSEMYGLIDRLKDTGPSVAEQQFKAATDQNLRQQMAMANSARGGSLAASSRAAQQTGAETQAQASTQLGMLRAKEEVDRRAQLYQAIAQQEQAELQAAGMDANMAQFQAQMQMQNRVQNDSTMMEYEKMRKDVYDQQAQMNMQADLARMQGQYSMKNAQIAAQAEADKAAAAQNAGLMGMSGTIGAELIDKLWPTKKKG